MKWSELPQEYRDLDLGTYNDLRYDDISSMFPWKLTHQGAKFWKLCHKATSIEDLPPIPQKEFVLPEKWCVKAMRNTDVHEWFGNKLGRMVVSGEVSYFHCPEVEGRICTQHFRQPGYTEITYDQWVRYVRDAEEVTTTISDGFGNVLSHKTSLKREKDLDKSKLDQVQKGIEPVLQPDQQNMRHILEYVNGAFPLTHTNTDTLNDLKIDDIIIIDNKEYKLKYYRKPYDRVKSYHLFDGEDEITFHNLEEVKEYLKEVWDSEIMEVEFEDEEHFYMIYIDGQSFPTRKHDLNSANKEALRLANDTNNKVYILKAVEVFEREVIVKSTKI